jgi:hypothetical protein
MTTVHRYNPATGSTDTAQDIDLDQVAVTVNGHRYTNADAERDADAAERRLANLRPGGKSLSAGQIHSPRFQVILGETTAHKVRAAAAAEGMSVSKWIRRVLESKVA